jgi:hypothetical protein
MPTEVPLVGDAPETLRALLPLLERKADRGFLEQAQEAMAAWREDMEALESPDRDPIQPQYLMAVVDRLAGDDAILTCDSGTIATWAARHWRIRGHRRFYLSGNLATMACGLPYAIAAQWAFPGRQCIAFVGDGGLAMLMAELDTAVRYDLPITVVVDNNASLGQIEWEQVVLGYPEYGVRYDRSIDFAQVAQACGAFGVRVERAGDYQLPEEKVMRAVVFHGVGDIRLDEVPDPKVQEPTDAVVRLTASAICGTDLHFVRGTMAGMREGTVLGHEGVGVVEEVGPGVRNLRPGDRVVISLDHRLRRLLLAQRPKTGPAAEQAEQQAGQFAKELEPGDEQEPDREDGQLPPPPQARLDQGRPRPTGLTSSWSLGRASLEQLVLTALGVECHGVVSQPCQGGPEPLPSGVVGRWGSTSVLRDTPAVAASGG